ncbi:adenosylcobinamide kinase/adenosylcobinamide phosphate guanyltransferase [Tenuifilaceae bacterium CYCD]|nr:adenosylcobinamide kinase/adenosylcobinamide phosphate guanyltransferase [Tenuifilaceae bacterium CYCD]
MAKVTLITGGQRSGKSRYAQKLAEENSANPVYLATARKWDAEFEARIERHKADRGEKWRTIELERFNGIIDFAGETVVMDCVTLWLNNIFFDNQFNVEISLKQAKEEWERLTKSSFRLIVVSNELGMGVIPENKEARQFADLQGWVNQFIASQADEVILMVSGIPLKVK